MIKKWNILSHVHQLRWDYRITLETTLASGYFLKCWIFETLASSAASLEISWFEALNRPDLGYPPGKFSLEKSEFSPDQLVLLKTKVLCKRTVLIKILVSSLSWVTQSSASGVAYAMLFEAKWEKEVREWEKPLVKHNMKERINVSWENVAVGSMRVHHVSLMIHILCIHNTFT